MNPIDQIAAEADEKLVKIPLFPKFKAERVAIIQAAIEKATEQERHDDAMEFSELVWFACLVEPFVSDHWSGKKDELSQKLYKACLRIRPITDKYQKNIPPTPATASEKGCTCDTTGEICRPSHDCPIHGIDKPDPATASETVVSDGLGSCGKITRKPDSASTGNGE